MKMDFLLLRQVHPSFFLDGHLSSQAFCPSLKDKGKLSVYDGRHILPVQSFEHYTQKLGWESVGVWGVSNVEVIDTGLTSEPDPLPDSPNHAVIIFGDASINHCRKLAKSLRALAVARGALYLSE